MSIKTMYITNQPQIAKIAENNTVDRIWVDLEIRDKVRRQHGMDTVISNHTINDVDAVKQELSTAELMVRVNPISNESKAEIDEVIRRGADIVMLPMYKNAEDVKRFLNCVDGRAKTVLLLETIDAEKNLDETLMVDGVEEIHIGMNDLHIQYNLRFMFELLSNGTVEHIAQKIKAAGKRFGFGGVAQLNQGMLPARFILAEHYRMGSSAVILSRTFVHHTLLTDPVIAQEEFGAGMKAIRDYEKWLEVQPAAFFEENKKRVHSEVQKLLESQAR